MAHRRAFPSRRRSVKQWIGTADQGGTAVASGAKLLIQTLVPTSAVTILRNRGYLMVRPQAGSVDLIADGAFGIGIVSEQAVTTGITAIPGPFTDSGWGGWLFHTFWRVFLDVTTDVGRLGQEFGAQYEIDSKAMRKLGVNERMVEVFESRNGAVTVIEHSRTLVLES